MYRQAGMAVQAICDTDEASLRQAAADWPDIRRYASLDQVLSDPAVRVVDLATGPEGRPELIRRAIEAGRHVLAQKPVAQTPAGLADLVTMAKAAKVVVAVNQNGRFAPAWRRASDLLQAGAIGPVRTVTHVYDTNLRWLPDLRRHGTSHFLLFDYSNHWIDISAYWLRPDRIVAVQAMDYDSVLHPDGDLQQSMWISMESASGASVLIRGAAAGRSHVGHDFIVQGTAGTLRGRVDSVAGELLELDDGQGRKAVPLKGEWFGDGFTGSMTELLDAIRVGRQPIHNLADNLSTVELVAAVCTSSEAGGSRVMIPSAEGAH
jgi:predicted dehydrogenase